MRFRFNRRKDAVRAFCLICRSMYIAIKYEERNYTDVDREERAEFTNLVMVYDDQGRILVEDRLDPAWPGVVFPGGHVDPGESLIHAAIREVFEETGTDNRRAASLRREAVSKRQWCAVCCLFT